MKYVGRNRGNLRADLPDASALASLYCTSQPGVKVEMAKSLDWGGLRGRRKEGNGGHQRTTSSPVAMEEENGGAEQ